VGEIVQHDNVPCRKGWHQDLFDRGDEAIGVDRTVDDAGFRQNCGTQARNRASGFSSGDGAGFREEPFAAWSPAMQSRRFG
jgi:hypothetical protein